MRISDLLKTLIITTIATLALTLASASLPGFASSATTTSQGGFTESGQFLPTRINNFKACTGSSNDTWYHSGVAVTHQTTAALCDQPNIKPHRAVAGYRHNRTHKHQHIQYGSYGSVRTVYSKHPNAHGQSACKSQRKGGFWGGSILHCTATN